MNTAQNSILIDACVLYPSVMREVVLGVAANGVFRPHWSARILNEWQRATVKLGPAAQAIASGEIVMLRQSWPDAEAAEDLELQRRLYLPDPDDVHVLASTITAGAGVLMTMNLRDFPSRTLAEYEISAQHPDAILRGLLDTYRDEVSDVVLRVHAEAERLSGQRFDVRALLKKAGMPRLGKALG